MMRLIFSLTIALAGCAQMRSPSAPTPRNCYVEAGVTNPGSGCSAREGYPDCYQVCPDQNTRKKL